MVLETLGCTALEPVPMLAEEEAAAAVVASVAVVVDQDQQDLPDQTEAQATQVDPVLQEAQESQPLLLATTSLLLHALHAPTDSQVQQDHLDQADNQEDLDSPDTEVDLLQLDHQDPQAQAETPDLPVNQAVQESPVHLHNLRVEAQDLQDHQVMQELQDNQEEMEKPEAQEDLAHPDPKDLQDNQAAQAMMVIQDSPVQSVNQAVEARRASAPSTAPSMEVSSLRTVLVVVKPSNSNNEEHCHETIITTQQIMTPIAFMLPLLLLLFPLRSKLDRY